MLIRIDTTKHTQYRIANFAATSLKCIVSREFKSHLNAYAAGSLLLLIDDLAINARSCRKLDSHPGLGREGTGAGGSDVRRLVNVLHASV